MATRDELHEALEDYVSRGQTNERVRRTLKNWNCVMHLQAEDVPEALFTMTIKDGELSGIKDGLVGESADLIMEPIGEDLANIFWGVRIRPRIICKVLLRAGITGRCDAIGCHGHVHLSRTSKHITSPLWDARRFQQQQQAVLEAKAPVPTSVKWSGPRATSAAHRERASLMS